MTTGGNDWTGQKLLAQIIQTFLTEDEAEHVFADRGLQREPGRAEGIDYFVELRDAGVFVDKAQGLTSDSDDHPVQHRVRGHRVRDVLGAGRGAGEGGAPDRGGRLAARAGSGPHDKPTILRTYTLIGLWISPNGTKKIEASEEVRALHVPARHRVAVHRGERHGTWPCGPTPSAPGSRWWPRRSGSAAG